LGKKGLTLFLEFGAQGFGRFNYIGLVFLGVLAKGLDKRNQNPVHSGGKVLRLFLLGGARGIAPAAVKQASYGFAEALRDLL
jgi:hypothetical protein